MQLSIFTIIVSIVFAITIAGAILVVISENRNPIRTLAWVLVLVFLPVIGIIFYYFFGQNTIKQRRTAKKFNRHLHTVSFGHLLDDNASLVPKQYQTLSALLTNSDHALVLKGSNIEVFTRGTRMFAALINDLKAARHHIHIQFFLFNDDMVGDELRYILMQKAEEGVEVRFLYENVANISVRPSYYYKMASAGVKVTPFLRKRIPQLKSVNYRNHRKVVVIDGKIGYIGGMNVGEEYINDAYWRDTHLRIEGQGVYGLQDSFARDWSSSDGDLFFETSQEALHDYFPACEPRSDNLLQIVTGGPSSHFPNIEQATVNSVFSARKYIYIQTPYFLPPEPLFRALQSASLAGIDVRLMVSKRSDSPLIDPAGRSYYKELLEAGMRIYEHQTKFIHAKTFVSDDLLSVIGSPNMDFRSFEASFEINCYIYDAELAQANRAIFMEDLEACNEIEYSRWIARPWWRRLVESFMRLLSPVF